MNINLNNFRTENLVISFCNKKYLFFLKNWLLWIAPYENYSIIIFALDKSIYKYCIDSNIQVIDVSNYYKKVNSEIWELRLNVFKDLIDQNITFIHSDLDAIWISNPINLFNEETSFQFSQGTIWPIEIFEKFKFVLCAGLVKIVPSEFSKKVLNYTISNFKYYKNKVDDQITLNFALNKFSTWNTKNVAANYIEFKGNEVKTFKNNFYTVNENEILLLPHQSVSRITKNINISKSIIVHPIDGERILFLKLLYFKKLKLVNKALKIEFYLYLIKNIIKFPFFVFFKLVNKKTFSKNLKY